MKIEDMNITVPAGNNALVYFSKHCIVTRDATITVPRNYVGLIYVGGKPKSKMSECANENLVKKFGGELRKEDLQVAFYSEKANFEIRWGIGGIQVNNDRLQDAYSVGVNGIVTCSIKDPVGLINYFQKDTSITVQDVWAKILPIITNNGVPLLSEYFSGKSVSIFEINSELANIRAKMVELIKGEKIFADMGLEVEDVTLNSIYVPEEDINRIKERING